MNLSRRTLKIERPVTEAALAMGLNSTSKKTPRRGPAANPDFSHL